MRELGLRATVLCGLLLALAACSGGVRAPAAGAFESRPAPASAGPVERLRVVVLDSAPHDPGAFTQGLVWHEGRLYESTGLYGRSSVREVEPTSGQVLRQAGLDPALFGEGLARVDDRLIQLTWREGAALVYDLATFEPLGAFAYPGEGWGLCYDGARLVMSDGSSSLFWRDPDTFAVLAVIPVTLEGEPVERLNELECVGEEVYANVWQTDTIVRIDARSGRVTGVIDASGLLAPAERLGTDVLNGIAYLPERETFLITGKLWPRLFEVRFVPA